jgi:type I restriction enzyme S subunit
MRLSGRDLATFGIPLPPLDEQRRIVDILEDHLSRLDAAEQSIANASTRTHGLLRATLASAFSSAVLGAKPRARLDDLMEDGRRIAYGVLVPGPDQGDGVPMVRVGDLRGHSVDIAGLKRIAQSVDARFPRTRLRGGEVLLSVVGTIGRTGVVPESLAGANVARAVSVLPVRRDVSPNFVAYALQTPASQRWLLRAAHEVARKTLNLEDVRKFEVPLPPRQVQDRLVAELDALVASVAHMSDSIEAVRAGAKAMRCSLLTASFSGRLLGRSSVQVLEEMASV